VTPIVKDIQSREDIALLINTFYEKVRKDELIGPFFTQIAELDWDAHLPIMYDFWESVLLGKSLYRRNTMQAHIELNRKKQLEKPHFDRWLALFHATCDELFSGPVAENAKTRSLSIATMIQVKVTYHL